MAETEWEWLYASIAGTGEMLFQAPKGIADSLLSGDTAAIPDSFRFRRITAIKLRKEEPEEARARLKADPKGPKAPQLVIETFPWVMAKEGAVCPEGRMAKAGIAWIAPPTEDLKRAASASWNEERIALPTPREASLLGRV